MPRRLLAVEVVERAISANQARTHRLGQLHSSEVNMLQKLQEALASMSGQLRGAQAEAAGARSERAGMEAQLQLFQERLAEAEKTIEEQSPSLPAHRAHAYMHMQTGKGTGTSCLSRTMPLPPPAPLLAHA